MQMKHMFHFAGKLIQNLTNNFNDFHISNFAKKVKCTQNFLTTHSSLQQRYKLGLGDVVYLYYVKPECVVDPLRYLPSGYKKNDYLDVYRINDEVVERKSFLPADNNVYVAEYILSLTKNVMTFIDNSIQLNSVKDYINRHQYIKIGKAPQITFGLLTPELAAELFDRLIEFGILDAWIEYDEHTVGMNKLVKYLLKVQKEMANDIPQKLKKKIDGCIQRYKDLETKVSELTTANAANTAGDSGK